jgi:ribosome-binding protein aMBF1 (putative translation factor)
MGGTDYSNLSVGTKIEGGEIQVCPKCGKRGLREITDGSEWFTHTQAVTATRIDQPNLFLEMCQIPKTPRRGGDEK